MSKLVTVDVRPAIYGPGYLLSVTRRYADPAAKGAVIRPGPRCSSKRTADEVAAWIEDNLKGIGE